MSSRPALRRAVLAALGCVGAGCGDGGAPPAPPSASAPQDTDDTPAAAPLFVDIAGDVGLDFQLFTGASGEYYFPEIMAAGAALFDFDNDGDLDAYVLQGTELDPEHALDAAVPGRELRTNRLYRNELVPLGELRFVDVTEGSGLADPGYAMGVATGDLDNDGDADLFLSNYGVDRLFRNDGDGRFTDVTGGTEISGSRWTTSASFFDYDLDGDLDLFATFYVAFNHQDPVECWSSMGTGHREYCGPQSLPALTDRLWRNDGDFRFVDVSTTSGVGEMTGTGLGTTATDFDGDGLPDVYVANDQQANYLWGNLGDGRFADRALMMGAAFNYSGAPEASMGVSAGDFDGDGDEDLFMTHLVGQTNTLMVNDGRGNFVDRTDGTNLGAASLRLTGFGTRFFDYDNDGWLDLFIANGAVIANRSGGEGYAAYAETNQLFRNEGGRFRDVTATAGEAVTALAVSRGAAFGDVDDDGDVDILVTNADAPLQLLENRVGQDTPSLRVRLEGKSAARDATGAMVALLREGRTPLWRRVHSDGSYLSASDVRVQFGLGEDPRVSGVGVVWPGGARELWRTPASDGELTLVQGTGVAWPETPSD